MTRRAKSGGTQQDKIGGGRSHGGHRGSGGGRSVPDIEKQLKILVRDRGYIYKDVIGDGNCLFRALSEHLYHTPDAHMYVRSRLADHIKGHGFYEAFIEKSVDRDLETFVKRINKSSIHGGHIELVACARSYGVNIEIYQLDHPPILIEGGWSSGDDECGLCVKTTDPNELPTIRLAYHSWGHYSCAMEENRHKSKHFPLKLPTHHDALHSTVETASDAHKCEEPSELSRRDYREIKKLLTKIYRLKPDLVSDKKCTPLNSKDPDQAINPVSDRWEVKKLISKATRLSRLLNTSALPSKSPTKDKCNPKKSAAGQKPPESGNHKSNASSLISELHEILSWCQNIRTPDGPPQQPCVSPSDSQISPNMPFNCRIVNTSASSDPNGLVDKFSSIDLSVSSSGG